MTRPTMLRIKVLLPAPFGPSSPRHSPQRRLSVMPSTAVTWPKRLTSPSTCKGGDADVEATGADVTGEDNDAISRFPYTILRIRGGICEGLVEPQARAVDRCEHPRCAQTGKVRRREKSSGDHKRNRGSRAMGRGSHEGNRRAMVRCQMTPNGISQTWALRPIPISLSQRIRTRRFGASSTCANFVT